MKAPPTFTAVSLGGGIQSSVTVLMASEGEVDAMPDCAVFADTRWEPPSVYDRLTWLEGQLSRPLYVVQSGRSLCEDVKDLAHRSGPRSEVDVPVCSKGPAWRQHAHKQKNHRRPRAGPLSGSTRRPFGSGSRCRTAPGTGSPGRSWSAQDACRRRSTADARSPVPSAVGRRRSLRRTACATFHFGGRQWRQTTSDPVSTGVRTTP